MKVGVNTRQSVKLQSHFVELYSKNAIRGLSLLLGPLKCFDNFSDYVKVENYVISLNKFFISNKKGPKKWWSPEVVHLF